jgi:hypothetical protein
VAETAGEEGGFPGFAGMSEAEVFRFATRPREIPGTVDWGIPPEVDPAEASDVLKVIMVSLSRE